MQPITPPPLMGTQILLPMCPYLLEENIPKEVGLLAWNPVTLLTDCLYWDISHVSAIFDQLAKHHPVLKNKPFAPENSRVYRSFRVVDQWVYSIQKWMLSFPVVGRHQYHEMSAQIVNQTFDPMILLTIGVSFRHRPGY